MNHRDERLGSAPLGKLMFSLALPSVAAQLINVLYNIVDRMYIGHIPGYGNTALTGDGVKFPILTMISAFSAFAGMGGAPLASIQLGKQNRQRAEQILGNSAGLLVLFSVILTAFFSIFKTPVLYAFGDPAVRNRGDHLPPGVCCLDPGRVHCPGSSGPAPPCSRRLSLPPGPGQML